jgi:hypothetical protein
LRTTGRAAIVVLLLLVFSAGFRKAAGVLVAVAAIIIGIVILNQRQSEREARERIPQSQLDFNDMILQTQYGSQKLTGRIKNNSHQYTLAGVALTITFEDCEGDAPRPSCVTIGEDKDHYYSVNIPPGQVRDVSEYVYAGSTHPRGKLQWHYSISYTEGK